MLCTHNLEQQARATAAPSTRAPASAEAMCAAQVALWAMALPPRHASTAELIQRCPLRAACAAVRPLRGRARRTLADIEIKQREREQKRMAAFPEAAGGDARPPVLAGPPGPAPPSRRLFATQAAADAPEPTSHAGAAKPVRPAESANRAPAPQGELVFGARALGESRARARWARPVRA
jgi:hypothetical protein